MPTDRTARHHLALPADLLKIDTVIVVDDEVRTVHYVDRFGPGWQIHFTETASPRFATAAERFQVVSVPPAAAEEFDGL